ncbi:MAG TPA: YhjD/YihY/BrkB family envelope integrity protein [Planctomycetota bacterium]|nr:YhjD/YihY/BrkB family envelope integrity protein [Planctomycetota bacterium]
MDGSRQKPPAVIRPALINRIVSRVLPEESSARVLFPIVRDKIRDDDIKLRASALAYSTLASLVPIFAIVLAILSGPAFESRREQYFNYLASRFVPADATFFNDEYAAMLKQQEEFKRTFEETIEPIAQRAGAVGVFGFIVLIIAVGLLFQSIENSFNAIWRATTRRSFFLRLSIATSLMFWSPVMLALSVTLTEKLGSLHFLGSYIVPGLFSSLAFAAFYMIMPNARVEFRSALAGGIAAAVFWEIAKLLFLIYIAKVVGYYHVYGSLGLIPMLFLWVYINWLIILYGAELSYVLQHRKAMVEEFTARKDQQASAELARAAATSPVLVLAAAIEIARRFKAHCPGGVRASQLAEALHVQQSLATAAASQLVAAGVLARVHSQNEDAASDEPSYLPAGEPQSCVISALLSVAFNDSRSLGSGPAVECARRLLASASAGTGQFSTMTLADLADNRRLAEASA